MSDPVAPGPKVPVAIPPPPMTAVLFVTAVRLSVTAPPMLAIAPPKSPAEPPVNVAFWTARLPPASTSKIRTAPLPLIVAPFPFTEMRVTMTGRPFSPLSAVVRA
ncbi:MAG TPA: hypothetical protein VGJ03_02865 [Acidimicrobiales bacterium]